ncbi:NIL domain-containing protein [Thermodesulfobacteriota bacterium]
MVSKRVVLRFPKKIAGNPIVYKLAKDYDLAFNILKADVSPDEEGRLVLEIQGEKNNYEKGLKFINESGIDVEPLSKDILRNDELCAQCGVCVPMCPSDSFEVDPTTRSVEFHDDNCVVCGLCVKICPYHAMSISF